MFEWIKSKVKLAKKSVESNGTWRTIFGDTRGDEYDDDPQSQYFNWVAACVNKKATAVASSSLDLFRIGSDGQEVIETRHDVLDLLNDVNPYLTRFTLFERLSAHLDTHGNEYWLMIRDKKGGQPVEIIPLYPWTTQPIADANNYIKGYLFTPASGDPIPIPKENIIHFKNFNPFSDILGLSTIETSSSLISTDRYVSEWNRNYYRNSAMPDVAISVQGDLTKDQIKRIREDWLEEYSGVRRAGKPAVLHSGTTITPIQKSMADMQFIEQQRENRDNVLAMFGVPKTAFGLAEDVNYASARVTEYMFHKNTVLPVNLRIANTLNEFLLPMFANTDGLMFKPHVVTLLDQESTTRYQMLYVNDALTINEWRAREGLAPVPNGDRFRSEVIPAIPSVINQPTDNQQKKIKNAVIKALDALPIKKVKEVSLGETPAKEKVNPMLAKPKQNRMSSEQFDQLGEMLNKAQKSREDINRSKFKDIVLGLFEDQKKRAIKKLDAQSKAIDGEKILDRKKEIKATIDLLSPLITTIVDQEGKDALQRIGVSPDVWSPDLASVRDYLVNNTKKLAGSMTDTTIDAIRTAIADGLDANEGIVEIKDRINSLATLSDSRADLIALSETHRASSFAELDAFKESGVVTSKIWYTAQDERVCPECDPMNGTEVALDDPFLTISDLSELGIANYDGDIETAMLHPQCRCTIVPVIKE